MAACTLTIRVEDDAHRLRAGHTVRGTVDVHAEQPVHCERLTVVPVWRSRSYREHAGGGVSVSPGQLSAGEHRRIPFEVLLPGGPVSYAGELTEVVWQLRATAELARARDPAAALDITVLADPEQAPDWHALAVPATPLRRLVEDELGTGDPAETLIGSNSMARRGLGVGCLVLLAAPLVIGALALGAVVTEAFTGGLSGLQTWLLVVLLGAIAVSVGAGAWRLFLRNMLARRRLGPVDLELSPRLVRRGQSVAVQLTATPRRQAPVSAVTLTLAARERHLSTTSERRRWRERTVFEETRELQSARDWSRGVAVRVEGAMTIPADAPGSFDADGDQVSWTATVCIRLRGGADWQATRTLAVHP